MRVMERVLPLGDPRLRVECAEVDEVNDPVFEGERRRLAETLAEFRKKHGFGRAIAAPQIGIARRFIAMNLGQGAFTLINPRITWRSEEKFTMWDDCMCFPTLFVRVERHASISLKFTDEEGRLVRWEDCDRAVSELLQHEIDHLDGILAVDRAIGRATGNEPFVSREAFDADPAHFRKMVDYVIS